MFLHTMDRMGDSPQTTSETLSPISLGGDERYDLDWDSEHDSRNPYNWTEGKRMYHSVCVAFYAFTV